MWKRFLKRLLNINAALWITVALVFGSVITQKTIRMLVEWLLFGRVREDTIYGPNSVQITFSFLKNSGIIFMSLPKPVSINKWHWKLNTQIFDNLKTSIDDLGLLLAVSITSTTTDAIFGLIFLVGIRFVQLLVWFNLSAYNPVKCYLGFFEAEKLMQLHRQCGLHYRYLT